MADESILPKLVKQLHKDPGLPVPNPTKSYWQQPPSSMADQQSPSLPPDTDVLIVGSGITACSIARQLLLEDPAIRVLVVDARSICSGATGRNGGHIKAVPEVSYNEMTVSKKQAEEVVDFTLATVEELFKVSESLSAELRQRSEVRRVESLNVFTDEDGFSSMQTTVHKFGTDIPKWKGRMRIVDKEELKSKYDIRNATGGAVAIAGAAWPYRLITGIFTQLLADHGTRFGVEANTPVETISYHDADEHYEARTPRGTIRARHIVHATNGHAGHLLPHIRGYIWPMRGQMTAQTPQAQFGVKGGSQSWSIHYGNGFDYVTQSGQSGEIFIGGALTRSRLLDELGNPRDDANTILPTAHLAGIMDATFGRPVRSEVKSTWTGVMGFTADGFPLVGRLPERLSGRPGQREWISAGYNGYGMPNAWLCGKHIADCILNKPADSMQTLPSAYSLTDERLGTMSIEGSARQWMEVFGDN